MKLKKPVFFFIMSANQFIPKKKYTNLNHSSFLNRYIEQIFFFIKLNIVLEEHSILFVIINGIDIRWIYTSSSLRKKLDILFCTMKNKLKKIIIEEIKNLNNFEKIRKFKQFGSYPVYKNSISSIYYLYVRLYKKYSHKFSVFHINPKNYNSYDMISLKKIILIGKNLNGSFNFILNSFQNNIYWYFAFLTNGVYCKIKKNIQYLIYTSTLLDILFTFQSFCNCRGRFFKGNLVTKNDKDSVINIKFRVNNLCLNCYSQYSFAHSQCFCCGIYCIY